MKHISGFTLSLNQSGTLDYTKLPKSYRKMLKHVGIKKKHLKNKEIAKYVVKNLQKTYEGTISPT